MFRADFPIDLAGIGDVQSRIEAYLAAGEAPQKLILRVRLVVEELLANLVMHGRFAQSPPPPARLIVVLEGDSARVTIDDAAEPFDPRDSATPPASLDIAAMKLGGLGLPLIRKTARSLAYSRLDTGWNRTFLVVSAL